MKYIFRIIRLLSFMLLFSIVALGCDKERDNVNAKNEDKLTTTSTVAGTDKSSIEPAQQDGISHQNKETVSKAPDSNPSDDSLQLYQPKENYGSNGYDHEDDVDVDRDIGYSSPIPYKGQIIAGFPTNIPIPIHPGDMTMRKDQFHGMTSYGVSFVVEMPLEELIKLYQSYFIKSGYSDIEENRDDHYFDIAGSHKGGSFSVSISPSTSWDHYFFINLNYIILPDIPAIEDADRSEAEQVYQKIANATRKMNSFAYKEETVTVTEVEKTTITTEGEIVLQPEFAEHAIHTNVIEGVVIKNEIYVVKDMTYLKEPESEQWYAAPQEEAVGGIKDKGADWTVFFQEKLKPAITELQSVKRGDDIEFTLIMNPEKYKEIALNNALEMKITQFELVCLIDTKTWFPKRLFQKTVINDGGAAFTSEKTFSYKSMNEIAAIQPPAAASGK